MQELNISINMKFWDDGQPNSTRIRNVNYCWNELKKLATFLKKQNINTSESLYDFSPVQLISDSKHVPFLLGEYKKAEKTNIILQDKRDYDFFMMMDCDAFFHIDDYNKLLEIISNLKKGDIITFDLAKLKDNVSDYIIGNVFDISKADWSYAYSGKKENGPFGGGYLGGLGGVYICDTSLLLELGGFDEKYKGWGGEDSEMLDRIIYSKKPHLLTPTRNFAPFHLPHFSDWGNELYKTRF
jgi:predicted glycosyltransferase involved in capsule biosynthesis